MSKLLLQDEKGVLYLVHEAEQITEDEARKLATELQEDFTKVNTFLAQFAQAAPTDGSQPAADPSQPAPADPNQAPVEQPVTAPAAPVDPAQAAAPADPNPQPQPAAVDPSQVPAPEVAAAPADPAVQPPLQ